MQLHEGCFFSVCWYGGAGASHNALLVFCGQAEPGSAPVKQLLAALVLPLGLTLDPSADSRSLHNLSSDGFGTAPGFLCDHRL